MTNPDIKTIRRQVNDLPGIRLDLRSGLLTIGGEPAKASHFRAFKVVSKTRGGATRRRVIVEVFEPEKGKQFRRVTMTHKGEKSTWCDLGPESAAKRDRP